MRSDFYVYKYVRTDGSPYYIGKGTEDRAYKSSPRDSKRVPTRNRIKFVLKNLSEALAFELEQFLISEIGRKDLGTGPLRNLSNGGEGETGRITSDETKQKIRSKLVGRKIPQNVLNKRKLNKHSDERKLKQAATLKATWEKRKAENTNVQN